MFTDVARLVPPDGECKIGPGPAVASPWYESFRKTQRVE